MRVPRRAVLAVVFAAVATLVAVAGVMAARRGDEPLGLDRLVIAAGEVGQVDWVIAEALAQAARDRWSVPVEVVPTAGAGENLTKVANDEADVGFAGLDVTQEALRDVVFGRVLPILALARLYDEYLQIVVPAGSPIQRIADLRGKRVSLGTKNSGADIFGSRVLAGVGAKAQNFDSTVAAVDALRSGRLEAIVVTGGLPTPVVAGLKPIRVLSVSADEAARVQDTNRDLYLTRSIPAGTYGLETDVATLGVPTILAVDEKMADSTAYRLTELLFAARNRLVTAHEAARGLDTRSGPAAFPADLHLGAKRYYRAAKPMALVTESVRLARPGAAPAVASRTCPAPRVRPVRARRRRSMGSSTRTRA